MKKLIITYALLMFHFANSQEEKESLRFNSISFSIFPLEYFITDNGGFASITLDASVAYKKNIFSLVLNGAQDIGVLGPGRSFNQTNLMYGRELKLGEGFSTEFHAGLGYFSGNRIRNDIKAALGMSCNVKSQIHL